MVRRVRYDSAFTFIYSKRTGTPAAAAMEDQVPEDVVKDRFDRLLKEVQDIAAQVVMRDEGTVQKVLVEEMDTHEPGYVTGRLSNNTVVHFQGDASLIGQIVDVSLDEARGFYFMGNKEIRGKKVAQLSPMMTHYLETKRNIPTASCFTVSGIFTKCSLRTPGPSRELETDTDRKRLRPGGAGAHVRRPPPCRGDVLNRLVQKGYKVAIAEQMEDPKQAKGLVKREVIRVVTPGTILSDQALDETKNNYLMAVVYTGNNYGIATVDITTGDFFVTRQAPSGRSWTRSISFSPSELICNEALYMSGLNVEELRDRYQMAVSSLDSRFFSDDVCRKVLKEHFKVLSLEGAGPGEIMKTV